MTTLSIDQLRERQHGTLPDLLGFHIISATPEEILAGFEIKPHHLAPNAYLHAASVIMLADTACGFGCMINLPEGASSFTTIELKSNFSGTAREGKVECVAHPVHLGRTTQIWDATVSAGEKPLRSFVVRK